MKQTVMLMMIIGSIQSGYAQKNEAFAIKKLLEKESATWRSGDAQAHADCWAIKPYSRILISRGDSTTLDVPPELMIHPPENMIGQGGSSVNNNYKMNVSGNNAWVSHEEVSTAKNGLKTYSYEFRILEKIKGKWKLVGQSIHVYKPKLN